jgi:DNA modification methylase
MQSSNEHFTPKICCSHKEIAAPESLIPHPRNPNRHSPNQIELLAKIIRHQGWRNPIVVSSRSGFVIAGHGRLAAALVLGLPEVPVDVQDFASEADEWAHLVADNRIAELAEIDRESLTGLLGDLSGVDDFDISMTGFEVDDLADLLGEELPAANDGQAVKGSLVESFGAAPFSVLDARQARWQERKRLWLESGIASGEGREDMLTFALSSQPAEVYEKKAKAEADAGRAFSWKEFADKFPDAIKQTGTSIFDPVLCELVLRWFCPESGRVLDPFAGGSVRGLVAAQLGLHYTGIDIRAEQVAANKVQQVAFGQTTGTSQWIVGDSRNLDEIITGKFDFILSCPPYADLEVYSDDPNDLSNAGSYGDFLEGYREVIAKAAAMLEQDAFACWVVGEIRNRNGWCQGFVPDTIRAFEDAGMHLYNEAILITAAGSLPMRARGAFEKSRKLGKTHQNVLIFGKGKPSDLARRCTLASFDLFEEEE